ncbi:hypothetical protein AWZ03_009887 [Drosophila navojoa]|uniref:Uncharacterized protein n=1 Tax=Drosophila navojoa TaxID=7232 RepID=A0A484B4R7_DRONA|nr:hypothetical protein AWZ03_009887 [Drosophila navojoa]
MNIRLYLPSQSEAKLWTSLTPPHPFKMQQEQEQQQELEPQTLPLYGVGVKVKDVQTKTLIKRNAKRQLKCITKACTLEDRR